MIEVVEKHVVRFTNDGIEQTWSKSTFPHPLVTVDHNRIGEVYGVTVILPEDVSKKVGE